MVGLFLPHSPDRVQGPPGAAGKKRCQGPPARSAQPTSPAAPTSGPCVSLPWPRGAGDDGLLRHTGRSQRGRGEAARVGRQGWKIEAGSGQQQKPEGKELFTYNTYSMVMLANKRIPVTESVWVELSGLKSAGQTYSDLLEEMIEDRKKARLFRDMERIEEEGDFAEFPW